MTEKKTNRCRNCKHFVKGYYTHGKNGPTIKESPAETYGMCLNKKIQSDIKCSWEDDIRPTPLDGILATCDEARGCLDVGPDFGCIHFERKQGQ